jgi:hypothetical protein
VIAVTYECLGFDMSHAEIDAVDYDGGRCVHHPWQPCRNSEQKGFAAFLDVYDRCPEMHWWLAPTASRMPP